jgi:hypothetical protein
VDQEDLEGLEVPVDVGPDLAAQTQGDPGHRVIRNPQRARAMAKLDRVVRKADLIHAEAASVEDPALAVPAVAALRSLSL